MSVVVVGGGAAGCALAARLSADRPVLLLEAGDASGVWSAELRDASTVRAAMPGRSTAWAYPARLTASRDWVVGRGRVLGGSSAVNGGYFLRARDSDLDRWARVGGERWSAAATLPVWRAMETDADFPASPRHGDRGPVPVARDAGPAIARAFTAAALARGHLAEPDKNGSGTPGIGPVASTVRDGVRVNMAMAYLEPVRGRQALAVRGDTEVLRVLVEGGRVVGVQTTGGDIRADEVVLCAGAVGSARILLASGIGPAAALEAAGIRVIADLPVGEAFADHPQVTIPWRARAGALGPASGSAFPVALAVDSSGAESRHPDGDLELMPAVQPMDHLVGDPAAGPGMGLLVGLQQPVSRGVLGLGSADPSGPLRIDYRYLEDEADRARLRTGIREACALLASEAFAGVRAEGPDGVLRADADDAVLDAWMRENLGTAIHLCATAPMGPVVDGAGRVHGIAGLRVADTSILPDTPTRGPYASAVLVGEVIARAMRE